MAARGSGANGGDAFGGGLNVAHGFNNSPVFTLRDSAVEQNEAHGGPGGAGGNGGQGAGGGIASEDGAMLTVSNTTVDHNKAQGGEGGDGGNGLGGGLYNDASSTLNLTGVRVEHNQAVGGEAGCHDSDGQGIGGRVYNLGVLDFDSKTVIKKNHASTSNPNIYTV